MAIECYYGSCKYHGSNNGDEGPFCFESDCRATSAELFAFETIRAEERKTFQIQETTMSEPQTPGHRTLTEKEKGCVVLIRAEGDRLQKLIHMLEEDIKQSIVAIGPREVNESLRWIDIARNDLQMGLMALTRAVTRPTVF
jgi:hypothetical protein